MMRTRLVRAMGLSLVAGSMAFSLSAHAAEGLYSADDLIDADVYDSAGEEVGEVEDILMGNDMSVHSLVIKTGDVLEQIDRCQAWVKAEASEAASLIESCVPHGKPMLAQAQKRLEGLEALQLLARVASEHLGGL